MSEKMYLVITLRRDVPDTETARSIYEMVKNLLVDHPEVIITCHTTNVFDLEVPTP